jgi:prepilin-type processing-associated H-X9-DG protein
LQLAWHMYLGDYNDNMPPCGATSEENNFGWVSGWMTNPQDATNLSLLMNSNAVLWPYDTSVGIYKCPSDTSVAVINHISYPRVRSVSMNGWMNGNAPAMNKQYTKIITYRKTKDLTRPGPAQTFVFLDECPATIDDDYFAVQVETKGTFDNWPADWHSGGDNFSFADGHGEFHRWVDRNTLAQPLTSTGDVPAGTSPNDVFWTQFHATAPVDPSMPFPP